MCASFLPVRATLPRVSATVDVLQMADRARPSCSTTVVLRKRKRSGSPLVLRLSSSPAPSHTASHSDSEYEPPLSPLVSITLDAGPSTTPAPAKKRYACDFEGCHKAYSKPARLAEHQRSHTGDVCRSSSSIVFLLMPAAETILLQSLQQVLPSRKPSTGTLAFTPARVGQAVHLRRGRVPQALLDVSTSPCARKTAQGREALQGASATFCVLQRLSQLRL